RAATARAAPINGPTLAGSTKSSEGEGMPEGNAPMVGADNGVRCTKAVAATTANSENGRVGRQRAPSRITAATPRAMTRGVQFGSAAKSAAKEAAIAATLCPSG